MSDNRAAGLRGTSYELFLVLLSLLSIVNAVLIVVPFLSGAGREVVIVMEALLTPVFLVDFLLRLARCATAHRVSRSRLRLGGPPGDRPAAPRLPPLPGRGRGAPAADARAGADRG